jgi:CRISPR/Cas system CSM-associated protein Csm3 (group 7 of RAMP superfamily)
MSTILKYNTIVKYKVTAVCREPMHIGSGLGDAESVLVHPVDGKPFVQATSIAGVFREACSQIDNTKTANELFGSAESGNGSRVRFSDGIFADNMLELRPHVKIDRKSQTADSSTSNDGERTSGQKFNTEYIGAGASFTFVVYLYDNDYEHMETLEKIFAGINAGSVTFGGKKSSGCGKIEVKLLRKQFDMKDRADRALWVDENKLDDSAYAQVTPEKAADDAGFAYDIIVKGRTEGALLVKSIAVSEFGADAPDAINIKNAQGEYIIPGSSLKGSFRSQMEKIAGYIAKTASDESVKMPVIEKSFGSQEQAGNLIFYDAVVGEKSENDEAPLSHRIHIDKFTGGVMHGGKFAEKNVHGDVVLHMQIRKDREAEADNTSADADATCGLLLYAIRDLAIHTMSLGSGYNIGKGMIDVGEIKVTDKSNGSIAIITFSGDESQPATEDEKGIITRCVGALSAIRQGGAQ